MNYNHPALCLVLFMVLRAIKEGYIKYKERSDPYAALKDKYGISYSTSSDDEKEKYDKELKERYGK